MSDANAFMVSVQATGFSLSQVLNVLTVVNRDLSFIKECIAVADANPAIWYLPGLKQLQPYEKAIIPVIDFLLQLDQQLLTILGQG